MVLAGYFDGKGTMVGLESATGIKRFEFHQRIDVSGTQVPAGGIEAGPSVVGNTVYWGLGSYGSTPFTNKDGARYLGGNRVVALNLSGQ